MSKSVGALLHREREREREGERKRGGERERETQGLCQGDCAFVSFMQNIAYLYI